VTLGLDMSFQKCVNNVICYICGQFTPKSRRRKNTSLTKKAETLGVQLVTKTNHGLLMCAVQYVLDLRAWLNGTRHAMPFAVPILLQ
jgi:hypothetical protein